MITMKVTVNEQLQLFWLAHNDGWKKAVGHGLHLGDYHFCVIPKDEKLNVTEVTTGLLAMTLHLYPLDRVFINDKNSLLKYIRTVIAPKLESRLHRYGDLTKRQNEVFERLGERPPIVNYCVQFCEEMQ